MSYVWDRADFQFIAVCRFNAASEKLHVNTPDATCKPSLSCQYEKHAGLRELKSVVSFRNTKSTHFGQECRSLKT